MGVNIEHFSIPVCNSFKPKFFNDKLCYEVDPNKFDKSNDINLERLGITFLVDTNEDRQFTSVHSTNSDFTVHLDTLGMLMFTSFQCIILTFLDLHGFGGIHTQY